MLFISALMITFLLRFRHDWFSFIDVFFITPLFSDALFSFYFIDAYFRISLSELRRRCRWFIIDDCYAAAIFSLLLIFIDFLFLILPPLFSWLFHLLIFLRYGIIYLSFVWCWDIFVDYTPYYATPLIFDYSIYLFISFTLILLDNITPLILLRHWLYYADDWLSFDLFSYFRIAYYWLLMLIYDYFFLLQMMLIIFFIFDFRFHTDWYRCHWCCHYYFTSLSPLRFFFHIGHFLRDYCYFVPLSAITFLSPFSLLIADFHISHYALILHIFLRSHFIWW